LAKVVAHLQREQLAERIALVRLGEEETRSLMVQEAGGADVSSQLAALVHRSTEGNPFFIHEVLRGLGERGEILDGGADSEWWDIDRIVIPESVRDVIGERLSRLGGEAQRILHEASVLGQTFSFEELEGIGEHGEVEVEEALEEARVAGLVQEAGPDSYSFDHALTQGTLYAELTARRKRRLYLAAGETLEGLAGHGPSGREAELANHFLRGGEPGRALTYSVLAGDAAEAVFAHIEAEQHYQAALEMTRDLGDQVREAETLEKLGSALSRQGRYEAALERLEAAAHAYQGLGDYRGEARVVAQIGRAHAHRGTARDGLTRIDHLLQRVTPLVPALTVAELFSVRSCILRELGSHEASLCDAEHAVDVARGLKEPEAGRVLAAAEAYRGIQLMLLGRLHDGRAVLEVACLLPKQRSLSTSPKVC
jgi:predicted ATPase